MLKAATNGFSKKNMVGKSERFVTYRGILRDGTQVRIPASLSRNAKLLFSCHNNLVQVYGWCSNPRLRALVTEWSGEESVETWLLESAPSLKHRLKVLVAVLKGMCYLEEQWPEVGCDLRTSNVFLQETSMEPLIARFGVFLLEMMTNGREAGYVKMMYPGNLVKVTDPRMKMTENTFDQAKQAIGIGFTCIDRKLGLGQIYNMISMVCESCLL
ncbi:hypothetical protein PTKIN_Ptkin06aG0146900 [Pterospermum kingtungense]